MTIRLQLTGKYEYRKHNIFVILLVITVILVMPTAVMISPIVTTPTKDLFSPTHSVTLTCRSHSPAGVLVGLIMIDDLSLFISLHVPGYDSKIHLCTVFLLNLLAYFRDSEEGKG